MATIPTSLLHNFSIALVHLPSRWCVAQRESSRNSFGYYGGWPVRLTPSIFRRSRTLEMPPLRMPDELDRKEDALLSRCLRSRTLSLSEKSRVPVEFFRGQPLLGA